jgi:hypothetical protein
MKKKNKIIKNSQISKISTKDLDKPNISTNRFDSTVDERSRNYETRKPEPRFTEYR